MRQFVKMQNFPSDEKDGPPAGSPPWISKFFHAIDKMLL